MTGGGDGCAEGQRGVPTTALTPLARSNPPQGLRDEAALLAVSDTDEQLLINIPFNQAVKLTSVAIKGDAADPATAPRRVRLFVDRPSLGFSEAESDPAAQEFVLSEADAAAGSAVPLRAAKFGRVTQLAVFIADNQGGGEETRVCSLVIEGGAGDTFDVAAIKKVEGE